MKTILVTGGAGFLGANLCRKLLEDNSDNKIICLDNFLTGKKENIISLLSNKNFCVIEHDVINVFPNMDVDEIYNLACPASPPLYQKNPIYTTKINVLGIINALDVAKKCGAKLLQASTSEIYGDPEIHPQIETYHGNVNCTGIRACYDEGKRCAESIIYDYHRLYHLPVKVVRIFNTYGPYMDAKDGRLVSNFIMQALQGNKLTIYGNGMQTRSLCYVDDLLQGLILTMKTDDKFIGPINLGNPEEYTVLEIAKMILKIARLEAEVEFKKLPEDDPKQRKPDITLAKEKIFWEPKINAKDGLEKTIDYFRGIFKKN